MSMAINLAPSQIRAKDLVKTVESVLKATAYPPSQLELEVTEDILIDDENALETFRQIKRLGVKLLLDDFGTGYASLSYLKNFPLSGLKIDKSFVSRLRLEIDDAAIVGSIVGLGTLLGLTVVAEGIEDRSTANLVARMGCKLGQGLLLRRADTRCGIRTPIPLRQQRRHKRRTESRLVKLARREFQCAIDTLRIKPQHRGAADLRAKAPLDQCRAKAAVNGLLDRRAARLAPGQLHCVAALE